MPRLYTLQTYHSKDEACLVYIHCIHITERRGMPRLQRNQNMIPKLIKCIFVLESKG